MTQKEKRNLLSGICWSAGTLLAALLLFSVLPFSAQAQQTQPTEIPLDRDTDLPNPFERDIIDALERLSADSRVDDRLAAGNEIDQPRDPQTGRPLPSYFVQRQADAQGGTRVPLLIPYRWTYREDIARTHGFKLRAKPKIYTAIFRSPDMAGPIDVVIDGSVDFFQSEKRVRPRTDSALRFDRLGEVRGGSISFNRFGASYLVQFICRDDLTLDAPSCINEEDARRFVLHELLAGDENGEGQ